MSGPFVFAAAAEFADRVRCSASIYGAGLMTERPDSPHLTAKQIRGEIYFACAEIDKYAPRPQIDALEAELAASGSTTGSSGTRAPSTASRSRGAKASTTSRAPSATGSGCSRCSVAT